MRRYRVLGFDFDLSARWLDIVIQDDWDEQVKESHRVAQQQIREDLALQYGQFMMEQKLQNYRDLGPMEISVIANHNVFFRQVRAAFVIGAYYPALTAACTLGERVLNYLVIGLREQFRSTPQYKRIYRRESFDDWNIPIDTLDAWNVLLPTVVGEFRTLRDLRNTAVHVDRRNPVTEDNDREVALEAIQVVGRIIRDQFGILGSQPWFIPESKGASFIKKDWEGNPFVRLVYLPNSRRVGPRHTLEFSDGIMVVHDAQTYDDREVSDAEFLKLIDE